MPIPNYRVLLSFDPERQLWNARAPELEHCQGEGATRAEAISRLEDEIQAQVESMLSHGSNPPGAVDDAPPPGDLRVRLSSSLHRELIWQARQEGVEVEQLVSELLAAGLAGGRGQKKGDRGPRAQGPSAPQPSDPNAHDNIGNTVGGGPGGGRPQRGGGGGGNYGNRGYNPAFLDDRANFIEYVRNLEQGQQQGGGYRGGPGGGPGGGGGTGRNRRRGPGGPGGRGNGFGGGGGGNGGGRP